MSASKNNVQGIAQVPGLYGLVVCGGQSSRMGADKSLLCYHEKPQRYHIYEMLELFCESVYISCNEKQETGIADGYRFMTDLPLYNNIGPMAALLTAFVQFPKNDLLMIGCDYPFLTAAELAEFILTCRNANNTTAFYDQPGNNYEPLLAYYPSAVYENIHEMYTNQQYSLNAFLNRYKAVKYFPADEMSNRSIDTYDDLLIANAILKEKASYSHP